jgi:UPF0716 protein FxsA
MLLLLFLFFVVLPITEISVFIQAGVYIGWPATIALTLGTAFFGSFLVRHQGSTALRRFMQSVERNELPMEPVADGVGILMAGVLLATPGFVTDTVGLLLFVPAVRQKFARFLFQRFLQSASFHVYYNSQQDPGPATKPRNEKMHKQEDVIDADFETIEPDEKSDKEDSPWRKK